MSFKIDNQKTRRSLPLSNNDLWRMAKIITQKQKKATSVNYKKIDWNSLENDWFEWLEECLFEKAEFTIKDATHFLTCRHCIGRKCKEYKMECIPLAVGKNGKIKVLVFGERNWKEKEHIKKVRWVDKDRVIKK